EVENLLGFGQWTSQTERPVARRRGVAASGAQDRDGNAHAQYDDDDGGGTDENFQHANAAKLDGTAAKVAGGPLHQTEEEDGFPG
ncbi:MAG: hypothetical protein ACM32F_00760, partial [Betaproteobacteria bacterium]